MNRIIFLFFSLILSTRSNLYADEESIYAETARLRTYAGGADESDLKVQSVLNQLQDKKTKPVVQDEPDEGF